MTFIIFNAVKLKHAYLNKNMLQSTFTAGFDSWCISAFRWLRWKTLRPLLCKTCPLLRKCPSNLQWSSLRPQTYGNFGTPSITNTELKAQRLAKQGLARFRLSQNIKTNSGRLSWALFIDQINNTHNWVRDGGVWITTGPTDDPQQCKVQVQKDWLGNLS